MKTKHTPGPWIVEKQDSIGLVIRWDNPFSQICVMRWTDGLNPEIEKTVMADANAIAAVPELIAACKTALDIMKHISTFYGLRTTIGSMAIDMLDGAIYTNEKAIAKAEGGQNEDNNNS